MRQTLAMLGERFAPFQVHEVPSGTQCFDWTVPDEWNIAGARLTGPDGNVIVDFADHNLHVVGYSEPIDVELDLDALQPHLHSISDNPDAIPYVTSYYRRTWGFCLTHNARRKLRPGRYHAKIDSRLQPGSLTYADFVIHGESDREVLLSSYICHPSMANNELSGPLVVSALARWLSSRKNRFTYRIVLFPETVGSIVYLSRHLSHLKAKTVAGFHVSCVGDPGGYGFIATPSASTLADRVARHALTNVSPVAKEYDFRFRGSDERQYCAPKINLPVVTIFRSKFGASPEYHTSLDDLNFVTPDGLEGGFNAVKACIEALEANHIYSTETYGEPFLSKYGLRSTTSARDLAASSKLISDVLAFSDGKTDLVAIADRIGAPVSELAAVAELLVQHALLSRQPQ